MLHCPYGKRVAFEILSDTNSAADFVSKLKLQSQTTRGFQELKMLKEVVQKTALAVQEEQQVPAHFFCVWGDVAQKRKGMAIVFMEITPNF